MVNYLLIISIIYMSGSVIGWVTPIPLYAELLAIMVKSYQIVSGKIRVTKKNALLFTVVITSFFLNIFLLSGPEILWDRKTFFVDTTAVFLCAATIDYEEFKKKYINVIILISASSIFFLVLFYMGIKIGASLVDTGEAYYLMNPFFIYGWNTTTSAYFMKTMRNFATFWEPGCFQAWVNYALYLHLQEYLNNEKEHLKVTKRAKKRGLIITILLVLTIVSTKSTTGYVVLILNLFIFFTQKAGELRIKDAALLLLGIVGVVILLNSPTVINKFSGGSSSYISFVRRVTDQVEGVKAALYSPIWGLGMYSPLYYDVMKIHGINGNSSGLLRLLQETGLPFGIWFTYTQMKTNLTNYIFLHKRILTGAMICMMFLILFSTEPINYTGVFFMMVFDAQKEKVRKGRWDEKVN